MKILTDRSKWPATLRDAPKVIGICVGGCVSTKPADQFHSGVLAHAHTIDRSEKFPGWICFRSWKIMRTRPHVVLHELAHINSNKGHSSPEWHAEVKRLGGTASEVVAEDLPAFRLRRRAS